MASIDLIRASDQNGDPVLATVTATRTVASTTLTVDAVTNWPDTFIATAGTVGSDGLPTSATLQVFEGHLSGSTIVIDSFAPGYSDLGNAIGDKVFLKPNTAWADNVADTLAAAHNDDGTLAANSVPTAAIQNEAVTNAKLKTGAGEPGGAWTGWTPTITGVSGGTLTYAKYKQIGKTVFCRFRYTLTGANITSSVTLTLPTSLNPDYSNTTDAREPLGTALFRDAGTAIAVGSVYVSGTTDEVNILVINASGTYATLGGMSPTVPFTWASGDQIAAEFSYEAA